MSKQRDEMITVELCDDYGGEMFMLRGRYLQHAGPRFDVPKETVDRWERVEKEWEGVQKEMWDMMKKGGE